VPYVVRRSRIYAFAVLVAVFSLAVATEGAQAKRNQYKPALTSSASGGASMDRFHHLGARSLRAGLKGHDVKIAQDYLRKAGFRLRLDGIFGPGMTSIVRRFQRANGLRRTGRLSVQDIEALRLLVEKGATVRNVPALPPTNERAGLNPDGTATPPAGAPPAVAAIIEAGNQIATMPYRYGGGHGKWNDSGYDCSGSVSFALHGAGLLDQALDSGSFESWGDAGPGEWVTIYANGGHAYMTVAGLRFDTSGKEKNGTRWQADMRPSSGYVVRHPDGL
jgi:peptidoglycan hydrolase-like protein with peptidoglycan-binding domain